MKELEPGGAPEPSSKWAPVNVASIVAADRNAALASNPNIEPAVGSVIGGKYRIVDRLGSGGMAVVYRAQERGMLTREVAIKVLTPESALSQATIARFLKEAQAISDVGHANVVQLIELGRTEEGQIYLVMERLVGKTLYEVLKEMGQQGEVFAWEHLAHIILQICRALHAAHKQKIIHRDIKPSNVFCCDLDDEQWHIKVLDFGIAKVQSGGTSSDSIETPLTQEGMFVGTPHYAAPEITKRGPEHVIDGRVDIFAVGVIMYQCLTGTLPFQESRHDRLAVMYKTAHERPESPRQRAPHLEIPPEVDAIIMRAMEVDVEKRFGTVVELMQAIRATLQGAAARGVPTRISIAEMTPQPSSVTPYAGNPESASAVRGTQERRPRTSPDGQTPSSGLKTGGEKAPPQESPTVQGPDQWAARGAFVALAAMLCGFVVLLVFLIRDLGAAAPAVRQPAPVPVAPPRGHVTPTRPLSPPVSASRSLPELPRPAAEAPEDPIPPSAEAPAVAPAKPKIKAPVADPSSSAARKAAIRTRLDAVARDHSTVKCLPMSTSFADGVFDELPVLVEVDASGTAKASIPSRPIEHRISKKADACILAVLGSTRFAPGAGAVKVSHTLRFD